MSSTQVTFDLADAEAERRFLREYMAPAWDRFEEMDAFESGWFWRHGNTGTHGVEGLEEGRIIFVVNGDPDVVIERERTYWEAARESGLLEDWSTRTFDPEYDDSLDKMRQRFGEAGGELNYRLRTLTAPLTLAVLEEFDEQLPPVGERSDENPVPVGFWVLLHFLSKQNGYDWYDEIDACTKAIKNRLRSLTRFRSEEEALSQLRATIEELESYADEIERVAAESA